MCVYETAENFSVDFISTCLQSKLNLSIFSDEIIKLYHQIPFTLTNSTLSFLRLFLCNANLFFAPIKLFKSKVKVIVTYFMGQGVDVFR